jgi:hypothetical protein
VKRKPIMVIRPRAARRKTSGWGRWLLAVPVAIALAYIAFFAIAALLARYPLAGPPEEPDSVRGAFHVHSTLSDGRGTPDEIAEAAAAAGLQFVILTDHNPTELPAPRFHAGVLLISGSELSAPAGHVVAVGMSRPLTKAEREREVFGAVAKRGGRAFIAHPEQKKRPWTDWAAARKAAGLELYSADSMFRMALEHPLTVLGPAAAAYLTHPSHGLLTMVRAQPELTRRALELAEQQPLATLCAHDAHGLPGYEEEFRAFALYLPSPPGGGALPADPVAAGRRVLDDVALGRAWCGFRAIASAAGFSIAGVSDLPRQASVGQTLTLHLPSSTPKEIEVRIHGPAALLEDGRRVRLDGPGAVHLEVWARVPGMFFQDGWKPWIVPSPIRVVPRPPVGPEPARAGEVTAGVRASVPTSADAASDHGNGSR